VSEGDFLSMSEFYAEVSPRLVGILLTTSRLKPASRGKNVGGQEVTEDYQERRGV
jgi:hypothetical protein